MSYSIILQGSKIPPVIVANGFHTSLEALNHLAAMYPEMKLHLAIRLYKIVKI